MSFPISRITKIAQVAHAADRVYLTTLGETDILPTWAKLSEEQQNVVIAKVTYQLENPLFADSGIHNQWVLEQVDAGWTYGKDYDPETKTDPKLKSFHLLPVEAQTKDRLFAAVVKALARV